MHTACSTTALLSRATTNLHVTLIRHPRKQIKQNPDPKSEKRIIKGAEHFVCYSILDDKIENK